MVYDVDYRKFIACLCFAAKEKDNQKKRKRKILKILETITTFDELAKEPWLKQSPLIQIKDKQFFVHPIHQKNGFADVRLYIIQQMQDF